MAQEEFAAMLDEVWKENLRRDSIGYTQDIEILMEDWGFPLSEIQKEVHLWQGEADVNTPPAWARLMAGELPHCTAVYFPEEAHFAIFGHWSEVLQKLKSKEGEME